ncbi:MAG: succinate dehydrogenase assembly factor 2 [Candidatus Thiodiazotropha sp. (ex Ctena orbiculata)]|uniref:FAD assembly factor SdhE n=1 Tax=Candidatus Thiodiazotropha taylori TaxID=2792791 RepID=A0A944M8Q4_9GAMM|nr:succinate dehydrogenase assembly factor 2 [Candidatus Thiodiazotropha taylori]PUB88143.1 MAG: succinate dehydrogenase assembly factor 2 family protein [gamma proteobacterium symbiont of Ctena orbiculata]MBT2989451.1 succinate dehydrogenase assembly factor 2 [Candidatus Thiodiazotropha taylori]MBT2997031.1 succinate dehydrogenase assembly factor 2 [Candidatus Thiodiazotropha taylori]MBT3000886.1 succinate dehydrogenase assembly factor 2 [Candidatus Thiodiazotropha taylori]
MAIQESDLSNIERLRWQCRRGMLELDVLLEAFLEQHYGDLPPRLKRHFVQLLEFPDPVIHAWCIGGESPEDDEFQELISTIRQTKVV